MNIFSLEFYIKNIHILGLMFVTVSLVAWGSELLGHVYVCPYCRLQRTVIGLLGLLMAVKGLHHWITAYISLVLGFMGAHVAAAQHFMGWKKISAGTFEFKDQLYIDPFLLSGAALFIITAQVGLMIMSTRDQHQKLT